MIRRPVRPSLKPILRRTPLRPIGPRGLKRRAEYAKYLRSGTWRKIRAAKIRSCEVEYDGAFAVACEGRCNRMLITRGAWTHFDEIHVHHKSYPKLLGEEPLSSLAILCRDCHRSQHWYRRF